MTIAILRTPDADATAYTNLEYCAARFGARVAGYIDLDSTQPGSFRGWPLVDPARLAREGVELVVAPTSFPGDARERLRGFGLPPDRMLSYATERGECQRRFEGGRWLVDRRPRLEPDGVRTETRTFKMRALATEVVPSQLEREAHLDLAARLFEACEAGHRSSPESGPFAIGHNWRNFMRVTRPRYYEALRARDLSTFEALLEQCFRNELSTGILGGREAYDAFVRAGAGNYAGFRTVFNVWRHSVTKVDIARLGWPFLGNPYGIWVGDSIVHANTFFNDHRAGFIAELVQEHDRPIVVELGGGYGGFGHQLFAHHKAPVYVDFDLPDNLLVASYFLSAAHPDKRVWLYDGSEQTIDAERLREFDIVLLPNFMLPKLADRTADAFVNFISLSEMDFDTIVEYLRQIDRVCAGAFYQENLLDNGEGFEAYPMWTFPPLASFRRVYPAPSRWPFFSPSSPMHCHGEQLFVRRDFDAGGWLDVAGRRENPLALAG